MDNYLRVTGALVHEGLDDIYGDWSSILTVTEMQHRLPPDPAVALSARCRKNYISQAEAGFNWRAHVCLSFA